MVHKVNQVSKVQVVLLEILVLRDRQGKLEQLVPQVLVGLLGSLEV